MIGLYLATGQLVNTVDNISGYPTFQVKELSSFDLLIDCPYLKKQQNFKPFWFKE